MARRSRTWSRSVDQNSATRLQKLNACQAECLTDVCKILEYILTTCSRPSPSWPSVGAILGVISYLILLERKLSAWMQDRLGPNRVGPLGMFQPLADGLKFLLKEEVIPAHVDKVLFLIAPGIALFTTLLAFAVVPFGPVDVEGVPWFLRFIIAPDVDIGIVFIFAVPASPCTASSSAAGRRTTNTAPSARCGPAPRSISYEIPLGMSVLGVALLGGTLNLEKIRRRSRPRAASGSWYVWTQPLACLIFFTSALAEVEPPAVRPFRVRAGTRRRLPHRIQRDEVRAVLPRRVHARHHDAAS